MISIAHISDLHFGREVGQIRDGLLEELQAFAPTLVAVSGDLTQRASLPEFQAAADFLKQLQQPALVVPGNHDIPGWRVHARLLAPWRGWRLHFGDPHAVQAIRRPGLCAIGVNTARTWGWHWDWSRGRIHARQLADIEAELRHADEGALRVVVAHHPFLATESAAGRGIVGRSEMALRRLNGLADLMLGGHVHLGYSGLAGSLVVAQSGTSISGRLKGEPNGYNRIHADASSLRVEVMRWHGDGFAAHATRSYRRAGSGWVAAD